MDGPISDIATRIACRIYLELYDAGDGFGGTAGGAIIQCDKMDTPLALGVPNYVSAREVLDSLEKAKAVFRSDASRPLFYSLDWDVRARMAGKFTVSNREPKKAGRLSFADRIREDLADYDEGTRVLPDGNFAVLEQYVRTGTPKLPS